LDRAELREDSVSVAVAKQQVTIDGQIDLLRHRLTFSEKVLFEELLSSPISWLEVSVSLLAILELIKRQEIIVNQSFLFGPIEILSDGQHLSQ
jgi:chromatin segregation and condensation protein Rec8/ScpA/Scc1 (kleisin family)